MQLELSFSISCHVVWDDPNIILADSCDRQRDYVFSMSD